MNNARLKHTRPWLGLYMLIFILACQSIKLKNHDFPIPEDTKTVPIDEQVKTSYRFDGVYADNQFDGARMNGFIQKNDSTFRVIISPENTPINASSYFSFRLRSEQLRDIILEIEYTTHKHRYIPKLSRDKKKWVSMESSKFDTLKAGNLASLQLSLDTSWLYVSAQELLTSSDAYAWADSLESKHSYIRCENVGQSIKGRDIVHLDIHSGEMDSKDNIVVFSRLHPPETSGYIAMKAFVEEVLAETRLAQDFRKRYRLLVYPMINPDGVDMGHWRHNAGGVDLNRDWSHYRQKEVKAVAEHLIDKLKSQKGNVILALDFHSTQEDVYYTLTDNRISVINGFKSYWFEAIDKAIPEYTPNEEPYDLNQPITKGWFYLQFGAESITFEVGDETPRDFVKLKASVAAQEMMKLLILRG